MRRPLPLKSVFRNSTSAHILSWMPVISDDPASSALAIALSSLPRSTLHWQTWLHPLLAAQTCRDALHHSSRIAISHGDTPDCYQLSRTTSVPCGWRRRSVDGPGFSIAPSGSPRRPVPPGMRHGYGVGSGSWVFCDGPSFGASCHRLGSSDQHGSVRRAPSLGKINQPDGHLRRSSGTPPSTSAYAGKAVAAHRLLQGELGSLRLGVGRRIVARVPVSRFGRRFARSGVSGRGLEAVPHHREFLLELRD
jgi:hypothetical protein